MTKKLLTLIVGLPLLAGCASINIDTDRADIDFSAFSTFAVAPPPEVSERLPGYSEIEGERIQQGLQTLFRLFRINGLGGLVFLYMDPSIVDVNGHGKFRQILVV